MSPPHDAEEVAPVLSLESVAPPALRAPGGGAPVLVVMGLLGGAALVWSVVVAARDRDLLPLLACVGASIAVLNEPIFDLLGRIVYASNHPRAFTGFDRDVPLFLLFGYIPWVGFLPASLVGRIRLGARARTLRAVALASFASVVVVELIGTATDNWAYYGRAPLKYLGVAPQLAPVPVVCAWLLHALSTRLRGWARGWLLIVPGVSLAAVFAGAGWPMYVALNSDVPAAVDWLAGAATLGLCAGIVWWVTDMTTQSS